MKKLYTATIVCSAILLSACTAHDQKAWCETPVTTEQVNLSADALFKFNKSGENDLIAHESLIALTDKLTNGYATVETINLVGHTDRLGSEQYNYNLGLSRAQTIGNYLQNKGVTAPISVESKGETQPVTTNCKGDKATSELIQCLQPDRRVEVNITGVRSVKAE